MALLGSTGSYDVFNRNSTIQLLAFEIFLNTYHSTLQKVKKKKNG